MRRAMITVLTSGAALGVHVTGVLLARRLREAGVGAGVEVLERWLAPDARLRIPAAHGASLRPHAGPRPARGAGEAFAAEVAPEFDDATLDVLLDRWIDERRRWFVVLSGAWIPALDRYAERIGAALAVDLCHVDAAPSPSFRHGSPRAFPFRNVWLLDAGRARVAQTIPVGLAPPVPWGRRSARCLAHGGGRGLGAEAERARALGSWGLEVDVVAFDGADLDATRRPGRHYVLDPAWRPWEDDGLPSFGAVAADGSVLFRRADRHHVTYELARRARAVIARPSGATLLDSLSAATPLVLLDPVGTHEARNAELWQRLGFGIAYDAWWRRGCSADLLGGLHGNLLAARPGVASYPAALAAAAAR